MKKKIILWLMRVIRITEYDLFPPVHYPHIQRTDVKYERQYFFFEYFANERDGIEERNLISKAAGQHLYDTELLNLTYKKFPSVGNQPPRIAVSGFIDVVVKNELFQ